MWGNSFSSTWGSVVHGTWEDGNIWSQNMLKRKNDALVLVNGQPYNFTCIPF